MCSPMSRESTRTGPRGLVARSWMPPNPDSYRERPDRVAWPEPEREHPAGERRGPGGPDGIVGVQDGGRRGLPPRRQELGEEPPLGDGVLLHRAVEVEVVLGEVREHGHVEGDAVHAVERERVGGHLHRHPAHAGRHHLREQPLQLDRLGRGLTRVASPAADDVLDGADDARLEAAGPEERLAEVRRGGLAVRARDADDGQGSRGMAVVGVGQPRQGPPGVRDQDPSDGLSRQGVRRLRHDRMGAALDRLGDEAVAVGAKPSDRDEAAAGGDPARVVREAADGHRQGSPDLSVGHRLEQGREQDLARPGDRRTAFGLWAHLATPAPREAIGRSRSDPPDRTGWTERPRSSGLPPVAAGGAR